jgi:hypothetical protein
MTEKQPGLKRKWVLVLGGVAAVSIAAVALFSSYFPGLNTYMIPVHIADSLSKAEPLKMAVEEFHRAHDRFPQAFSELGEGIGVDHQYVGHVELLDGAGLRITFSGYMREIEDKAVILVPAMQDDGALEWSCHSEDIDFRFLPPGCR